MIPKIEASRAYKKNGLIAITFDEAPQTGPYADQTACCANPAYPNLPATTTPSSGSTTSSSSTTTPSATTPPTTSTGTTPTATSPSGTTTSTSSTTTTPAVSNGNTTPTGGGGQVGLLLISPYIKPNTTDTIDYFNHYSLLASIELLLSLKRIGYASPAAAADSPACRLQRLQGLELVAFPAAVEQLEEAPQHHRLTRSCRGT